jgi:hypothetical protein
MEDDQPILVDVSDLRRIQESLNAAYYKSLTEDLVDTYRTLNKRQQESPLTKDLEVSLARVTEILAPPEKTDSGEDESN